MPDPARAMDRMECPWCRHIFLRLRRGDPSPMHCLQCGRVESGRMGFKYLTLAERGQYVCQDCEMDAPECVCAKRAAEAAAVKEA